MPEYDVNIQLNLSISVEANTAEQAGEIALGEALEAHLADGNFTADVVNVDKGE